MSDTVIEAKPANPKADKWAERIAAQARCGMSVKQFCKEQGLTEYSFYAWRKRLQENGPVRFALVERSTRRQERTAEPVLELVLTIRERLRIGMVARRDHVHPVGEKSQSFSPSHQLHDHLSRLLHRFIAASAGAR